MALRIWLFEVKRVIMSANELHQVLQSSINLRSLLLWSDLTYLLKMSFLVGDLRNILTTLLTFPIMSL